MSNAVAQGLVGDIGDISTLGHSKGNLKILTAIIIVAKKVSVFIICLFDGTIPVERCTQMDYWTGGLRDDRRKHLVTNCKWCVKFLFA